MQVFGCVALSDIAHVMVRHRVSNQGPPLDPEGRRPLDRRLSALAKVVGHDWEMRSGPWFAIYGFVKRQGGGERVGSVRMQLNSAGLSLISDLIFKFPYMSLIT